MITPGARVRQERLNQRITVKALAARAKMSVKTLERIERDQRTDLLPLIEELLGLPSSADPQPPAVDEAEMLRRTPHRRFWLEAARRAEDIADMDLPRPTRDPLRDIPLPPPEATETDDRDERSGDSG